MDYWWKEDADSLKAADGTDLKGSELEDYLYRTMIDRTMTYLRANDSRWRVTIANFFRDTYGNLSDMRLFGIVVTGTTSLSTRAADYKAGKYYQMEIGAWEQVVFSHVSLFASIIAMLARKESNFRSMAETKVAEAFSRMYSFEPFMRIYGYVESVYYEEIDSRVDDANARSPPFATTREGPHIASSCSARCGSVDCAWGFPPKQKLIRANWKW